ncbi:DUF1648 domain-containing protein [Streptomyces sp. NPDC054863]
MTLHMTPARLRLVALTVAPFALALLVSLATFLISRDDLPDPLAGRFDLSGKPTSYLGSTAAVVGCILLFTLLAAAWAFTVHKGQLSARGVRGVLAGGWGMAGLLGHLMSVSTLANRGVSDGSDVRMPMWHLAAAVGVALAAAAVGLLLARTVPQQATTTARNHETGRIDLARGEVASWSHRLGSGVPLLVAVVVLAGSVACAFVGQWYASGPLLGLGLLILGFASAHVMVDRRGLTVAPSLLPWPSLRIPLKEVQEVHSREINPVADYGGWGYRVRSNRTGLILRSGEAIVVRRGNGREFAVTVGDSATGAALLATLIDRRESR